MNDSDIIFDKSLPLLAVSPSTWTATPLTRWFDNYKIISSIDNPLSKRLSVIDIREYMLSEEPLDTVKNIFASSSLKRLEEEMKLHNHSYVMNRAGSDKIGENRKKLTNDPALVSQYENKAWFRRKFSDKLRFADYRLIDTEILLGIPYEELEQYLTSEMVIQHPSLAGSRGTFIVKNDAEYRKALEALRGLRDANGEPIVVSKYLKNSIERTVQACVTRSGVRIGPAQSQLLRHPDLAADTPGEIQFCGGRIDRDLVTDYHYNEMVNAITIVGEELQRAGYRGIFGMDFLIHEEEIYTLETNPRMTGMTPLLANLQNTQPFLLLHVLELANQEYSIREKTAKKDDTGASFIQVYAQADCIVDFRTGVYDTGLNYVGSGFEDGKILPSTTDNYFIGLRVSPGTPLKTGKSIAFIYSRRQLFDDHNNLDAKVAKVVADFRHRFIKRL